ncbi:oxygen-insensitive NADPH nitroreductase [Paenibacillus humicola]|uniref:oxygen-insensitive NADPH nitroreductase n=1 Tax=Paenibacillus humicola TaxID=3110540 RepID=UPI00237A95DC|nr:oxygen-insensitive NADPH nitroreductase [Paenibacillus humicola]
MNGTIERLLAHRSIRKYKPDVPVTQEQLETIIAAGQAASTSSNIQAYSIVGVTDPERKARLAELAGNQKHIVECPQFLVWCADLNRLQTAAKLHDADAEIHMTTEAFVLATVDTALAAQNAAVAAESLGFGIVYIGGIRNNPRDVAQLLQLPKLVYPLFGMCIGVPDQEPDHRPRLPLSAVYHRESYSGEVIEDGIRQYDETMQAYYNSRAGGGRDTVWSKEVAARMAQGPLRPHLHDFLHGQGFRLI